MRRSAAPSIVAGIKKARFLPHVIKNISLNKEKEGFPASASEFPTSTKDVSLLPGVSLDSIDSVSEEKIIGENTRTDDDILDLILDADSRPGENLLNANNKFTENDKSNSDNSATSNKLSTNLKPLKRNFQKPTAISPLLTKTVEEHSKTSSNCIYCTKNIEEASLFNVVYCKRSGKKHKTWEGDGILIVKSRSAVLKDFNGKLLDKGIGYKLKETESLEDGSKFFIGGKECEIQSKISEEEYLSGKYCKCSSDSETFVEEEKPLAQTKKPC